MSETSARITGLDGLRGFASLAVVLFHLSLIARPELSETTWAWLTQSPLKILFPGTESVLVFFALSGLVVALPLCGPISHGPVITLRACCGCTFRSSAR